MKKQPQMFSWMNPKLEIKKTINYGNGVFTTQEIKKGEILFVMGGYILTINDENNLRGIIADKPIEISDKFSIGPRKASDLKKMPQHYVNHSCEPNAGFNGQIFMVAIKKIKKGEEVCYDYAMVMNSNKNSSTYFTFKCLCNYKNCRKLITEDDWKKEDLQKKYKGFFQWFIQNKISEKLIKSTVYINKK
jgi:hypothetical protein